MMMRGKSKKASAALGAVRNDVDAMRDRLIQLREERARVESLPNSIEEIGEQVDRIIADVLRTEYPGRIRELRASGPIDAGRVLEHFGPPIRYVVARAGDDGQVSGQVAGGQRDGVRLFGLLCHFLGSAAMRDKMLVDAPTDGISMAERTARLVELDRQILAVECAEEVACRELDEVLGRSFLRRLDANPAILLAPDEELA